MHCGKRLSTFQIAETVPWCHPWHFEIFTLFVFSQQYYFWQLCCKDDQIAFRFVKERQQPKMQDKRGSFFFIQLVYNGDMKADRNGARLPAWLNHQPAFIFLGESGPSHRQQWTVKLYWDLIRNADGIIILLLLHCAINVTSKWYFKENTPIYFLFRCSKW